MIITDFTNTYIPTDYPDFELIKCSDISGCDMYCDDEAKKEIKKRLAAHVKGHEKTQEIFRGIHLIDSGNYHYMTRIFTEEINEPYDLVFFDNHTDMKPAMFDMLSCGSWAKEVLEKDENLRKMYMIGPRAQADELSLEKGLSEKLVIISQDEFWDEISAINNPKMKKIFDPSDKPLPVYLSIDKDLLDESEVKTNWDQGNMSLKVLIAILKEICKNRTVLGADICGLFPESAGNAQAKCAYENGLKTDIQIINALSL